MNIDLKALHKQKLTLLQVIDNCANEGCKSTAEDLTGILHLIDALQDEAVKNGTPEEEVFLCQEQQQYKALPWRLTVAMSTDDDCELTYKGEKLCSYNFDLKISENFETQEEAIEHLKLIEESTGDKASEWTAKWLADCAEKLRNGQVTVTHSSNQEYDIELREITEK